MAVAVAPMITLGVLSLVEDGLGDIVTFDHVACRRVTRVTLHETTQRALGPRPDARIEAGWDDVDDVEVGLEERLERRRVAHRQLGVGAAPDRGYDALDGGDAALLDHRDVAGPLADDLVDGRAEDRQRSIVRCAPSHLPGSAPAEEDEVGFFLRRQLHDAFLGAAPDADDGVEVDAFRHELEDPLQEAPRLACTRGAFG